jgi:hypothetical protein
MLVPLRIAAPSRSPHSKFKDGNYPGVKGSAHSSGPLSHPYDYCDSLQLGHKLSDGGPSPF